MRAPTQRHAAYHEFRARRIHEKYLRERLDHRMKHLSGPTVADSMLFLGWIAFALFMLSQVALP